MKINTYLCLPGTAKEALKLYGQVFGVEPEAISYFKDTPPEAGMEVTPENADRVMHASFKIGDNHFMVSDAPGDMDLQTAFGNATQVSIHPDSKEEADRIFALLSEGGTVVMPMADAFWGDYFGMVKDRFGIAWMVNYSTSG